MSFWEDEDPKNYQHFKIKSELFFKSLTGTIIHFRILRFCG